MSKYKLEILDDIIELVENVTNSNISEHKYVDYLRNLKQQLINSTEFPCKPGDTVYLSNSSRGDLSAYVYDITINENGVWFGWSQEDFGPDGSELWDDGCFELNDIGETVFLTWEEAAKVAYPDGLPTDEETEVVWIKDRI